MVEIIGVDIGLLKVPRSKLSLAAGAGVSYECVHVVHSTYHHHCHSCCHYYYYYYSFQLASIMFASGGHHLAIFVDVWWS